MVRSHIPAREVTGHDPVELAASTEWSQTADDELVLAASEDRTVSPARGELAAELLRRAADENRAALDRLAR